MVMVVVMLVVMVVVMVMVMVMAGTRVLGLDDQRAWAADGHSLRAACPPC